MKWLNIARNILEINKNNETVASNEEKEYKKNR